MATSRHWGRARRVWHIWFQRALLLANNVGSPRDLPQLVVNHAGGWVMTRAVATTDSVAAPPPPPAVAAPPDPVAVAAPPPAEVART